MKTVLTVSWHCLMWDKVGGSQQEGLPPNRKVSPGVDGARRKQRNPVTWRRTCVYPRGLGVRVQSRVSPVLEEIRQVPYLSRKTLTLQSRVPDSPIWCHQQVQRDDLSIGPHHPCADVAVVLVPFAICGWILAGTPSLAVVVDNNTTHSTGIIIVVAVGVVVVVHV
eukprot:scaffold3352_cov170-Amphora_coffeaeformis.AAC.1